ncbi:MAG TPA: ATP-binding protein [Anaeromyxobacter sp.]|nr:ATP-binding protein [Anaeromyxobacter sp.]
MLRNDPPRGPPYRAADHDADVHPPPQRHPLSVPRRSAARHPAAEARPAAEAIPGLPTAVTWLGRRAWLPIPLLAAASLLALVLGPGAGLEAPRTLLALNFVFSTILSLFVADLVARAFIVRGTLGLLLLGCGAVVWGTSDLAASAADAQHPGTGAVVHGLCACASAACHLAGAALSVRRRRRVRAAGVWVPASYLTALAVVASIALVAREGWAPPILLEAHGVRHWVLLSAAAAFALAALLLALQRRPGGSAFVRWYALALLLLALGLADGAIPGAWSWLAWLDHAGRYLGSVYLAVAAVAALRESRAWGASVELALRATERRYEALFTSATDAILLSDPDGSLVAANPAAQALLGRPEAEICRVGRAGLLAPGTDLDALLRRRGEAGHVHADVQFVRKDGSRLEADYSSVTFDSDGRAFDIVRDVTERRRTEEALREADRRKNAFLAVLSHELRNPLTPIRNGVRILRGAAPGSEPALRAQTVIERQVEQLARLVDDLLDVTRITRDRIQLRSERLELGELVRRTVEDHRSLFQGRGVDLRFTPAPDPIAVEADPQRLAQIVGNLLQNAAKFTPRGGHTRVAVEAPPGAGRAVIRVADDGVGMSPELRAGLFQPFMQADTTLDRSEGGLGLGLALVKGLVELHRGSIEARSDGPGRGSEFEVAIPLAPPAPAPSPPEAVASPTVRRRVLVIEDNEDAGETLREVLELQGHEVVAVARSGADGLASARVARPDVVLCDIGLPAMDGYEVARAFRADAALRGTRLVALSGYAQPEDLTRAAEAGFDAHLAKPPDLDALERFLTGLPAPHG